MCSLARSGHTLGSRHTSCKLFLWRLHYYSVNTVKAHNSQALKHIADLKCVNFTLQCSLCGGALDLYLVVPSELFLVLIFY